MSNRASAHGWKGIVALVSTASAAILLAGCGESPSPSSTPTATPAPSGTPSPSPAPLDLKPILKGLLDRSGTPPAGFTGSLAGFVVNIHWNDLQPTSGIAIAPSNAIDKAITEVRALNAAGHLHLGLKIRIFAGVWAPEWVKALGGSPITITNPQSGQSGTIGRFWTDAFGSAYDHLETLLAAKYDQLPEIREVTISRCTTFYDEPFIRDISDPNTVSALIAAGYTAEADTNCQQQEIDAASVWRHTHSDLAFNPYQAIGPGGTVRTVVAYTNSMMVYCRQVLGTACVLENNSLRSPPQPEYLAMYAEMLTLGQPIAFQTASEQRIGSLQATLTYAVTLGANSVELPGGYQDLETPASFSATTAALALTPTFATPVP